MTRTVVRDRTVVTFEVNGWPVGVLTGIGRDETFHLEHVIAWPGAPPLTVLHMLRGGIQEAWDQKFSTIVYCLPDGFPPRRGLEAVGRRLGFEAYAHEEGATWFCLHKS